MDNGGWTADIESILENIRVNCVILSKAHKKHYFLLKETLKYYKIPSIILNGINSITSVGLQPYLEQGYISIINCVIALVCSIIGSIELYLGIQTHMENEAISQRDFYLLSVDIFKTLSLCKEHRPIPAKDYLDKKYNTYCKLIERSNAIARKMEDKLCPLPADMPSSPSSLSLIIPDSKNNSDEDETFI